MVFADHYPINIFDSFRELTLPGLWKNKFLYLETIPLLCNVKSCAAFSYGIFRRSKPVHGGLNIKAVRKILYKIRQAEQTNDPELFKKLRDNIWEFRIRHFGRQIRLLAFWDKGGTGHVLVLATHGFFKKTDKAPGNEIDRALHIREKYFINKNRGDG